MQKIMQCILFFKKIFLYLIWVTIYIFISLRPAMAGSEIDEIKLKGKLRIGVCTQERKPFYYKNEQGKLVGIDIELGKLIAEALGVKAEFVQIRDTWNEVVQDVANNDTDIAISYISITPRRALKVAFSKPYISISTAFLLNKEILAEAKSEELDTIAKIFASKKYKLYTPRGSSYTEFATQLFRRQDNTVIYQGDNNIPQVLEGKAAGLFTDQLEIAAFLIEQPEHKMRLISYPLGKYADNIAIPISYDKPVLLSFINALLTSKNILYTSENIIEILKTPSKEQQNKL